MVEDREFEGTSEEDYWKGLDKYLRTQMWRPEDWEEIRTKASEELFEEHNWDHTYERGADDMLKALIDMGIRSQISSSYTGTIWYLGEGNEWKERADRSLIHKMSEKEGLPTIGLDKKIGYLIFIPEGKQNGN